MITLDMDTVDRLRKLPVAETVNFALEDRRFTIVDQEEFDRICGLAGLAIVEVDR